MTLRRYQRYERAWKRAKRKREIEENAESVLRDKPASNYGRACSFLFPEETRSHPVMGATMTIGKNIHRCNSCRRWWTTEAAA